MNSDTIIPNSNSYYNSDDFLKQHLVKDSNLEKTHTRIGKSTKKSNGQPEIYGGSFHIPDAEQKIWMDLYYNNVIAKNKKEYITEKQLNKNGPIVIDFDFKHDIEIDERQYTIDHIEDMLDELSNKLKDVYMFDNETNFKIIILEKQTINRIHDKHITKDGIHCMIWIKSSLVIQQLLRIKLLTVLPGIWNDLQLKNSWEDVVDERVSRGEANWQLVGSRKPDHDRYKVSRVYEMTYDEKDGNIIRTPLKVNKNFIKDNLYKLSVRYQEHPAFLPQESIIGEIKDFEELNNTVKIVRAPSNPKIIRNTSDYALLTQISSMETLDYLIDSFIEKNSRIMSDYHFNAIYKYVMILPKKYYEQGSYDRWIRVGWVLFNMSVNAQDPNKLLIVWIKFSSQASNFMFSDIIDICERWSNFDLKQHNNLTKLSLYHWAKLDAPQKYNEVRSGNIDFYVEETLKVVPLIKQNQNVVCGDWDLARVLYQLLKDEYVCVSIKQNIWYQYINHRWQLIDSGTSLRKAISTQLKEIYIHKSREYLEEINKDIPEDEEDKDNNKKMKTIRALHISSSLGDTKKKNNILIEAKELFYDGDFVNKLDTNFYLLGFNNGVYDFSTNEFRSGKPEDNISFSTGNDYIDIRAITKFRDIPVQDIIKSIHDFMNSLFPIPELCTYMWQHLASTLVGTTPDQTFNMYIGSGRNGKSVLTMLMKKVLGQYMCDVNPALITEKRCKVGGLAPEIVDLKGRRYAVIQESTKGDALNEGIMKQLTSGKDQVQGRSPFALAPVSFIPQLKLVLTCNSLMKINSNDNGTWRRIRTVPFLSLFTEKPVNTDKSKPYQFLIDNTIDEKFDMWKEVFTFMLIEKCVETKGKVNDCNIVLERSKEYQKSQDYLSEFIEERIVKVDDPGKYLRKSDLNLDFKAWYSLTYDGRPPTNKELHEYITSKFGKPVNQKWLNITLKEKYNNVEELLGNDGINEM